MMQVCLRVPPGWLTVSRACDASCLVSAGTAAESAIATAIAIEIRGADASCLEETAIEPRIATGTGTEIEIEIRGAGASFERGAPAANRFG